MTALLKSVVRAEAPALREPPVEDQEETALPEEVDASIDPKLIAAIRMVPPECRQPILQLIDGMLTGLEAKRGMICLAHAIANDY